MTSLEIDYPEFANLDEFAEFVKFASARADIEMEKHKTIGTNASKENADTYARVAKIVAEAFVSMEVELAVTI